MAQLRNRNSWARDRRTRIGVTVILAAMLPLFFIAWNVRILTNSSAFYGWGFDNYSVERRTGLQRVELDSAARQIIDYFNNDQELLDVRVNHAGREIKLFNQREITHMSDVKDVMNAIFTAGWITGGVLIVVIAGGFFFLGREFLRLLRAGIIWSTIAGLAIAAFVGLATLIDFDTTFRLFHEVTFRNDFWKLSPSQSMLLRMFPQGFWFAATLLLIVVTVAQLGVVFGAATWAWRRFGRGQDPSQAAGVSATAAPEATAPTA